MDLQQPLYPRSNPLELTGTADLEKHGLLAGVGDTHRSPYVERDLARASQLRNEADLGIATMLVDSGVEVLARMKFAHLGDPKRLDLIIQVLESESPEIIDKLREVLAQKYSSVLADSFAAYFQKLAEFRQTLIQVRDEKKDIPDMYELLKLRMLAIADAYDQFYNNFRERN